MPKVKDKNQIKWLEDNPEAKEWIEELRRRSEKTAKNRSYHLYHYFMWLKERKEIKTAKQLLDEYKHFRKEEREYEHNKYVKQYLFSEINAKKSYSWREGAISTVREFYRYNHLPLPDEKIDLRHTQVDAMKLIEASVLRPMTLEDFKRLIAPAKIREKSVLLTMLQSGMGVGELTKQFNICMCSPEIVKKYGHVCVTANVLKQLKQNKHPIKIYPLVAYKQRNTNDKRVVYFTFIGKDAIDTLKQYLTFRRELVLNSIKQLKSLEERQKSGHYLHAWEKVRMEQLRERLKLISPECREGEPIYITNLLNPVGEHSIQHVVRILKKQTGLLDRQFTPHTCRDLFKTTTDHVGVKDTISEYWIRHKLDEYGYNQLDKLHPEDFEKEYLKVEPALNIISKEKIASPDLLKELEEERAKRAKLEEKLEKLEKFVAPLLPIEPKEILSQYRDEVETYIKSSFMEEGVDVEIADVFYDVIMSEGGNNLLISIRGFVDKHGEFHKFIDSMLKPLPIQ